METRTHSCLTPAWPMQSVNMQCINSGAEKESLEKIWHPRHESKQPAYQTKLFLKLADWKMSPKRRLPSKLFEAKRLPVSQTEWKAMTVTIGAGFRTMMLFCKSARVTSLPFWSRKRSYASNALGEIWSRWAKWQVRLWVLFCPVLPGKWLEGSGTTPSPQTSAKPHTCW